MSRISRRDFLKLAATTAVAATVLSTLSRQSSRKARFEGEAAKTMVKRSLCFICGQKCPIKVYVKKVGEAEVIERIEFNHDGLEHEYAACGRPQTIFEARFIRERIRRPLLRVGENRFREISWDEALDILAKKLKEYRPEEIVVFAHQGCEVGVFTAFFKEVVGIPNVTKHCDTCHTGIDVAGWWVFGKMMGPGSYRPDYRNAKLVVFMGRNPLEGIVATPWTKLFAEGRKSGMRVIVFDVRRSRLTTIADRYYVIPPGTDLAVALAILNVILNEKLYNEDYVRKYTNASMLLYADTLEPVKLIDHPSWKGKKTYLVLDEVDGKVKPKTEASRPALDAEITIEGRKAKTVLRVLREAVAKYTPEWASMITGVPAEDIRWIARELAREAPRAFIDPGYKGTRYYNESMLHRVIRIIDALIGAFGARGGIAWPRKVKIPSPFKVLGIKGSKPKAEPLYKYWESERGYRFIHPKCYSMLAMRSIFEGKPRKIKMVIAVNENIVAHIQGSNDVIKALREAEFVVVIDSAWSETAVFADLILPLTMFFEQDALSLFTPSKTGVAQVAVVEKIVDPPPGVDARPGWWILKELGKRLDPEHADLYEKLADVKTVWRLQAEKVGVDFNKLMEKGVVALYREPIYHPLKGKYFDTVTGEIELISVKGLELFRDYIGSESTLNPLPVWVPPRWMKEKPKLADNEFIAVDIAHRMTATNMWIRFSRLVADALHWDNMDGVLIHEERARRLGLKRGDRVKIVGPGGTLVARVIPTKDVHPYVILGPHAMNPGPADVEIEIEKVEGGIEKIKLFSHGVREGINTNVLARLFDDIPHEGGRAMQCDIIVRVEKA